MAIFFILEALEMMEAGWVKEIQLDKLERWNQDFDYQYLFEENLTPRYFENVTQLRLARLLQKKLAKDLETKYYALLLFDGDSMGKWLSGANLKEDHNQVEALKKFHTDLAGYLGAFSKNAFNELNGEKGRAIYAGGDDFLGFVNLEHLFDMLAWMRSQFDEQISQKINHKKVPFTFSAGLVIAHYKTPLHVVLDWARATEKAAKKHFHPHGQRKDTLGISVMRASGEITQAFVPWSLEKYVWNKDTARPEKQQGPQLCTLSMKELTESLRTAFSDKWLRSLASEFSLMQDGDGKLEIEQIGENIGAEMINAELKRLLTRACSKHGEERDKAVQALLPHLHSLLGPAPTENFGNFMKTLYICDFIERHTYGPVKSPAANPTLSETSHA